MPNSEQNKITKPSPKTRPRTKASTKAPKKTLTTQTKGKKCPVAAIESDSNSSEEEDSEEDDEEEKDDEGEEEEPPRPRKKQKQRQVEVAEVEVAMNQEPETVSDFFLNKLLLTMIQVLQDRHIIDLPEAVKTKSEAADVNLVFSDNVEVRFTDGSKSETLKGRWCLICKYVSYIILTNTQTDKLI